MELIQTIPRDVARRLGYYVYAYVSPLDNQIFYVGKGKGLRVLSHLSDRAETRKVAALRQIRAAGKQPRIEILAHGLRSADAVLQVEAAVIDALGLPSLTNQVRGWRSSRYGRTPLEELIAFYRRRPVRIQEPSILIRITEVYRPQMTPSELYDATRASWKLGPNRERSTPLPYSKGSSARYTKYRSGCLRGPRLTFEILAVSVLLIVGSSSAAWLPNGYASVTSIGT
ncbi:MAG: hypothetical protein WA183_17625 [Chthoniobacterales bacterium]